MKKPNSKKKLKIVILGATGRTGRELLSQGLERGIEITPPVRSPEKIQLESDRLKVVAGDPLNEEILTQLLVGKDAVLSVLGHVDLKQSHIVTEGARSVIAAMESNDVKRLVILSSALVAPGGSFLTKIPRYITRHAIHDSAEMEKVVNSSSLDWTIVRLPRLTNKAKTSYRISENEPPSISASISRKTVASCMLNLVSNQSNFRKTIGVRTSK